MPGPRDPPQTIPLGGVAPTSDPAPDPITGTVPVDRGVGPERVAATPASAGRYVLGDEIAAGGMGVVYRATDTMLGREVAVKPRSRTAVRQRRRA